MNKEQIKKITEELDEKIGSTKDEEILELKQKLSYLLDKKVDEVEELKKAKTIDEWFIQEIEKAKEEKENTLKEISEKMSTLIELMENK